MKEEKWHFIYEDYFHFNFETFEGKNGSKGENYRFRIDTNRIIFFRKNEKQFLRPRCVLFQLIIKKYKEFLFKKKMCELLGE